ncbi:hypothetical protein [Oryza sativa Japonica Group]|uniref:Uncharacterized protein n=2 Tax=Oryza sativa subsp. japonica TaxID=39947 RepID=Q657Q7_ORYSJ|nr:hypothetical protein [Oryza sativa Japonica Group]BAD45306.1 hypothetical protein [Oryza sativa Japonica Group]
MHKLTRQSTKVTVGVHLHARSLSARGRRGPWAAGSLFMPRSPHPSISVLKSRGRLAVAAHRLGEGRGGGGGGEGGGSEEEERGKGARPPEGRGGGGQGTAEQGARGEGAAEEAKSPRGRGRGRGGRVAGRCVWVPGSPASSPSRPMRKSGSTGSITRWHRNSELVIGRSHSDGKEKFRFLSAPSSRARELPEPKPTTKGVAATKSRSSSTAAKRPLDDEDDDDSVDGPSVDVDGCGLLYADCAGEHRTWWPYSASQPTPPSSYPYCCSPSRSLPAVDGLFAAPPLPSCSGKKGK